MYHEQSVMNRDSWRYTYLGSELLEAAQRKRDEFLTAEEKATEKVIGLLEDKSVPIDSSEVRETKEAMTDNARQHEQCVVFCHEFARNPEREYHLALGDVVFFGLTGNIPLDSPEPTC